MKISIVQQTDGQEAIKRDPVIPFLLLLGFLGTSFEMVLGWEEQRRRQEETEKEKVKAELSFLKDQINPHFLFNCLNNIYSLSEQKSPKTGEAILLLSNIMRYVLYDTNRGLISLDKELQHIRDFIEMERLRISSHEKVSIDFTFKGDFLGIMIEPLILMPFVENAFKYGVSYDQPSQIAIDVFVGNGELVLWVFNSKKDQPQTDDPRTDGGIGIKNTRRRLDLIYGRDYTLDLSQTRTRHQVRLTIKL